LIFIGGFFGAFLGTDAAGDALVHVHVAGLFSKGDLEVARAPGDVFDSGEGEKLNV